MKKTVLRACVTLTMALTTLTALAADVSGSWTGDVASQDGNAFHLIFTFKQDGAKLTGSIAGPQDDPIMITEGTVDGDKITFKISFNGTTITDTGTIDGDTMKLNSKADDGSFPAMDMTLKRSK